MAKKTGLGANCYIGGYDLSNDIGAINGFAHERGLLPVTGLDKSAVERVPGLYTGSIDFTGFFNDAALAAHVILKTLPTADTQAMLLQGTTLGDRSAGMLAKQVGYAWVRGADGSLGIQVQALSTGGDMLNWGQSLTAGKRSDSAATNGTGVNMVDPTSGDTNFGAVLYLQVFSFTGTSCTVSIEESNDDGSGDAYAAVTGGGFAAATGITHERLETSLTQTVEDWLRAVSAGTFSECTFAVVGKRYDAANAER